MASIGTESSPDLTAIVREGEEGELDQDQAPEDANEALDYKEWSGVDVIEGSTCMECGGTGKTMLMLHKIPFFREIIIGSFKCDSCHARNNEVTFGGEIQPKGSRVELRVSTPADLNRQLIKSDSASVSIPELEFEIPPGTQKGEITTLEGLLKQAANNLGLYQKERMEQQPEVGTKVALVIMYLHRFSAGEILPFTVVLDDCSGNSFIENPLAPAADPMMKIIKYTRSAQQDISLGLNPQTEGVYGEDTFGGHANYDEMLSRPFGGATGMVAGSTTATLEQVRGTAAPAPEPEPEPEPESIAECPYPMTETDEGVRLGRDEIMVFQEPCPNCSKFGEARNAMTNIPHFKEVLIMSFNCLFCGYRTNEVRGGGAIPAKGMQITVTVGCEEDMKRDVLKGHSAMLQIPEMELELSHGSLGGVYTTVEGLINKVYTNLRDNNPFAVGDSISKHHSEDEATSKREFVTYLTNLKELCDGKRFPWTLILRDPLANSFVSAPIGSFLPPEADFPLQITEYIRTSDEDDEFGIADMNTRDFETLGDMESNREAYYNPESILPDRLTHITAKGPDHPRAFAQGVRDSTPGGVVFSRIHEDLNGGKGGSKGFADGKKEEAEEEGEPEYCTPPEGYSAARIGIGGLGGIEDYPESLKMLPSALLSSGSTGSTAANAQVSQQTVGEVPPPVEGSWDGQVGEDYGKRHFENDSALADRFEAREEFAGRREGFVYRLGSLGLGYYPDARKFPQ